MQGDVQNACTGDFPVLASVGIEGIKVLFEICSSGLFRALKVGRSQRTASP